MEVKRIVRNVVAEDLAAAQAFYADVLGLKLVMDHGWIRTYAADTAMQVQLSFASEGGSGTEVPDLSIEVADLEQALARVESAGVAIVYGPVTEPWGVRRFYVRDPFGQLLNIMQHLEDETDPSSS
ncbi:MAG: VOC family protein [Planctomycetota bacterium]